MGMSFFKDYEKTTPKPAENPSPAEVQTMSTDDMKAYFDAMRESIINEVTNQIKGGQDNASSSDLPDSQSDSTEPSVDGGSGS